MEQSCPSCKASEYNADLVRQGSKGQESGNGEKTSLKVKKRNFIT